MQHTPAAVWIPGAQTLSTGPVLLTWLDGNLGDLKTHERVRVTAQHEKLKQDAQKQPLGVRVYARESSFSRTSMDDWASVYLSTHFKLKHKTNQILSMATFKYVTVTYTGFLPMYVTTMSMSYVALIHNMMGLKCLLAQYPRMSACEMSTAWATVAFILSQRTSREQVGSVGQRKLLLCHQWALVCTGASVHLSGACTNTPTHGDAATDAFLKSAFEVQFH